MKHKLIFILLTSISISLSAQNNMIRYYPADTIAIDSTKNSKYLFATYSIQFELGSSKFTPESYACLDSIVKIIQANDSIIFEVRRYSDYTNPISSTSVGMQRANAIIDYFVGKGIARDRFVATAYDRREITPDKDSVEGKNNAELNNRTEFIVLSNKYVARK